jgi:hypothetical protein
MSILSATPNATVRNNNGNDFDIGDLNASNATLHSGVTAPDGWQGGKHTYDGSAWGDVSAVGSIHQQECLSRTKCAMQLTVTYSSDVYRCGPD